LDIPDSKYAIKDFISEVRAARAERSEIIHLMWQPTESELEKMLVDPRYWKPAFREARYAIKHDGVSYEVD
jgi:hypothetical protein